MYLERKILSKTILIFVGIFYLLNLFVGAKLSNLLVLSPAIMIHEFEFWRIFTFPLTPGYFEGVLLFFAAFYFFAPKIEEFLRKGIFPIFILLLVCLHGLLHTIVFWESQVQIAGFEGISIFILALFTLQYPRQRIKLWIFPSFKAVLLTVLLITIWSGIKSIRIAAGADEVLIQAGTAAGFGIIGGIMIYFQILLIQRLLFRRKPKLEIPQPEELKLAMMAEKKAHAFQNAASDDFESIDSNIELSEEKLNSILDKIFEHGSESLSPDEIKFLEEYSKRI
jgi:membrane associated rhomboid family serine protease